MMHHQCCCALLWVYLESFAQLYPELFRLEQIKDNFALLQIWTGWVTK